MRNNINSQLFQSQSHVFRHTMFRAVLQTESFHPCAFPHHVIYCLDVCIEVVFVCSAEVLIKKKETFRLFRIQLPVDADNNKDDQYHQEFAEGKRCQDSLAPESRTKDKRRTDRNKKPFEEDQDIDQLLLADTLKIIHVDGCKGIENQTYGHTAYSEYGKLLHTGIRSIDPDNQRTSQENYRTDSN